jgi:ubiquinone/menaquinone biosynthesis C-methylase UbiE
MLNTGKLTYIFRKLGLMHSLDTFKFIYQHYKNRQDNHLFRIKNPNIAFPPDYMMFEAFNLNYQKYIEGGKVTARWVVNTMKAHKNLKNVTFLDWGCGPARITRHLSNILDENSQVFGTDYNQDTINWCVASIPNAHFSLNQVNPPLNYDAEKFDAVLGISIFTHLSEEKHTAWVKELYRVTKKNGVLMLTTHGNAYTTKLTNEEKSQFEQAKLVVRANVKEGHRVFAAFHLPVFMRELFEQYFTVLEHCEGKVVSWGIEQDYWILEKQ